MDSARSKPPAPRECGARPNLPPSARQRSRPALCGLLDARPSRVPSVMKATDAAANDGAQLGAVLDRGNIASAVWAYTAYRSAANIEMLEKRGLKPQFQCPSRRHAIEQAGIYALLSAFSQRWSPFPGQLGGLGTLDPISHYAASLMVSTPVWASKGVLPPKAECGLSAL